MPETLSADIAHWQPHLTTEMTPEIIDFEAIEACLVGCLRMYIFLHVVYDIQGEEFALRNVDLFLVVYHT